LAEEPNIEGSSHEQRVVIARAYDHFHATGVWPTFGQLDRPLYNEEQIEVVSVLRSIPNTLVLFDRSKFNPPYESPIQLRLTAIASCVGSESDLDLYFVALRWFATQERLTPIDAENNEREVSRQEFLNFLSTTKHGSFWVNATKVISLVLVEGGLYRSTYSQDADGEWRLRINRNIRWFENVHNLDDYDKAMKSLLSQLNANTFQVPAANFPVLTEPEIIIEPETMPETAPDRYVFLIMPFHEPWSDATHELIKSAIELVPSEPKLRTLRSDEIDVHGDITDQIIEAIGGATLVLADVTSTKLRSTLFGGRRFVPNANVMWELGYSMAREAIGRGAPNVLISQNPAQAPFDLAHLRQLPYSIPTNDAQIQRLATMITANLPLAPPAPEGKSRIRPGSNGN
jgi:hypothetical protein